MALTDIIIQAKNYLNSIFDPSEERENEAETIENILKGINFRGSNLWVLIFAIFIASLGLNVNSTAVIIGAMLISPLMGPIMGIGLGIGINDFELIKKAFRNLAIATIFGILTSTLYFLISPLNEARSELLARTTPTIYDVLIAFFGGLAGIVASSTKLKGNVIPGVAIATALMPPLCTAGFGIASGNFTYFFGAFYLYMINSVFIAFATTLGVKLMHFKKKVFVDKAREKRVQQIVYAILIVTMVPSVHITYIMIKKNIFENNAARFISNEIKYPNTFIVNKSIHEDSIAVTLIGKEIPNDYIGMLHQKLAHYHLEGCKLHIEQGINRNKEEQQTDELSKLVLQDFYKQSRQQAQRQEAEIIRLQKQLNNYVSYDSLSKAIVPEIQVLFPDISSIALSQIIRNHITGSTSDTLSVAILRYQHKAQKAKTEQLHQWLSTRLHVKPEKLILLKED
ncbi:MAG: DUF389 domain-containing protein [Odoribacter sp.]|nr:DUF389 domain-containing protein [Odoribacter sp.]